MDLKKLTRRDAHYSRTPGVCTRVTFHAHTRLAAPRRLEATPGSCQLQLMLLYEVFDSEKAAILYPVNILRNYAR